MSLDESTLCPPHHWDVTIVQAEDGAQYRHSCFRCSAVKHTPVRQPPGRKPFRISSKPLTPRA